MIQYVQRTGTRRKFGLECKYDFFYNTDTLREETARECEGRRTSYFDLIEHGLNDFGPIETWWFNNELSFKNIFKGIRSCERDLSLWDTSLVPSMDGLFGTFDVRFNISDWDTSSVTTMQGMFWGAQLINEDLQNLNTRKVTSMNSMFRNAEFRYYTTVLNWNTSLVTDMAGMFYNAINFNTDLMFSSTKNVKDMSDMFNKALAFNGQLSNFETQSVTSMKGMFKNAEAFTDKNSDTQRFDVSHVNDFTGMFESAFYFKTELKWKGGSVCLAAGAQNMFRQAGMYVGVSGDTPDENTYDVLASWCLTVAFMDLMDRNLFLSQHSDYLGIQCHAKSKTDREYNFEHEGGYMCLICPYTDNNAENAVSPTGRCYVGNFVGDSRDGGIYGLASCPACNQTSEIWLAKDDPLPGATVTCLEDEDACSPEYIQPVRPDLNRQVTGQKTLWLNARNVHQHRIM